MGTQRTKRWSVIQGVWASAVGLLVMSAGISPAQAAGYQVLEMPVIGRSSAAVIQQAEQLARTEVINQFRTNPQLSEVQVDIVGQRNGQIVPILSTRVSRQQWQATPQIASWTQYYDTTFYGLLNPDGRQTGEAELVAAAPTRLQVAGQEDPSVALDQMVRAGRIDYDEYLELVDAVD